MTDLAKKAKTKAANEENGTLLTKAERQEMAKELRQMAQHIMDHKITAYVAIAFLNEEYMASRMGNVNADDAIAALDEVRKKLIIEAHEARRSIH